MHMTLSTIFCICYKLASFTANSLHMKVVVDSVYQKLFYSLHLLTLFAKNIVFSWAHYPLDILAHNLQ